LPGVNEMDENEKHSSEEQKPSSNDKKLHLDLSEAMPKNFDDDDDIIELKDEVTVPANDDEAEIDLDEQFAAESSTEKPSEEKIIDLNALNPETAEAENVSQPADNLVFEEEDEDDLEIQDLADVPPLKADGADEVMEITEFDDILSEDDNQMITLSEEPQESESADEFLELIDVEEDRLPEIQEEADGGELEDEIIQFDGPSADIEDVELEDFINDSLNENIQIDDDLESDLTDSLGIEAGHEISLTDPTSEPEEFNFEMDSSEISKKIDQLEDIFFDDTQSETEFNDEAASDIPAVEETTSDTGDTDFVNENENIRLFDVDPSEETSPDAAGPALDVNQDQIDKSIERIIQQNFSGKIESMITQIIENAVSKEISRLKNILMEDSNDEDL
jgi:hypothetical protein